MKLVKERLYEYLNFTEDGDPISDMDIGRGTLIKQWLKEYEILSRCIINSDETINSMATIVLKKEMASLPSYIKFKTILGGFHTDALGLTSLEGFPSRVKGSLFITHNNLKNLINGPEQVEMSYGADFNKLETLEGISHTIGTSLYLNDNRLKSLEYIPKEIFGSLIIYNNPLETIEHFPEHITGDIIYTPSAVINDEVINKICKYNGQLIQK